MFPAEKKGEYEPYKIWERRREVRDNANNNHASKEDVEMKDANTPAQEKTDTPATETVEKPENAEEEQKPESEQGNGEQKQETVEEIFYEEDITTDEGAIYPLDHGRIVDWPCFFALLTHIHNTLSPPFHTPILLIAEPVWTARDREAITQFVFEKFKTPAFTIMDSALAVCYGYGTSTATVVDVGKGKVDVTAVTDFLVNEHGRGIALEGCGGDYMTDRFVEMLGSKGFTWEMCEQLKRSNITEILPPGTPLPGAAATARQGANPAASVSTGAPDGQPAENVPRGPGDGTQTGTEAGNAEGEEEEEGVLDVAAIVSGNTSEYLAQREKEKATSKKGSAAEQQAKAARLPNSKKEKATFQFEEFVPLQVDGDAGKSSGRFIRQTREIEIGAERFLSATPRSKAGDRLSSGILEDIATQIHHTILAVPDATKRSELWDSLIVVGNGSKIKGSLPCNPHPTDFTDHHKQDLHKPYLVQLRKSLYYHLPPPCSPPKSPRASLRLFQREEPTPQRPLVSQYLPITLLAMVLTLFLWRRLMLITRECPMRTLEPQEWIKPLGCIIALPVTRRHPRQ